LIAPGKARDRGRRFAHSGDGRIPNLDALRGENERPDAAVVRRGTALDEPTGLESVDETRDVRGIAGEVVGDHVHRRGEVWVEAAKDDALHGREVELAHRGDEVLAGAEHDLPKGRPSFLGVGSRFPSHCHRIHDS
jgi:hypothetical protein